MIERKYLFHFLDAKFNRLTAAAASLPSETNFVRLGKHLQQYNEELNPQVNTTNNILGEQVVLHTGYQVSSTAEPYYAEVGDPLWEKLQEIANKRITGDGCETTRVDGLMDEEGNVLWAYMESCKVIPTSLGGDTTGVQIPFQVHNCGNRQRVNFDLTTKTATKYAAP